MGQRIDQFCESLRLKLTNVDSNMDSLKAKIDGKAEGAEQDVRHHLDSVKKRIEQGRAKVTAAQADVKNWVDDRKTVTADKIAETAEFFSFGTNDLTQTALGMSRDDYGPFISAYTDPKKADDNCARAVLTPIGRYLFRRPLTDAEQASYVQMANAATSKAGDFYSGIQLALGAMLVSPNFLYIVESGEPDPAHPGQMRLDNYSRAARLSYLLWDTTPSTVLLDAADRGELTDGNAPTQYYRTYGLFFENPDLLADLRGNHWELWQTMPLKELPRKEIEEKVTRARYIIRELEIAGKRKELAK